MSEIDLAHRALVAAQGKALALLAIMLNRNGALDAAEFGKLLGTFAVLSEDDATECQILAHWSDIVSQTVSDSAMAVSAH